MRQIQKSLHVLSQLVLVNNNKNSSSESSERNN